jgi:DNA-binding transcriptional ArsR family regulator
MGLKGVGSTTNAVGIEDVEVAAELLKRLSNPQRLQIVYALAEGEQGVSDLERKLEIRQPSLSQHLGSLREAGIITGRREAKAVFYRISDARAAMFVEALHAIFSEPPRRGSRKAVSPASGKQTVISTTATAMKRAPYAGEAAFFARVGESADM